MPLKLLIVDKDCTGLGLAWRAAMHGHKVRWWIGKERINQRTGEGFEGVQKVDNWIPHATWADLIFTTGNDQFIERLSRFPTYFGPSVASANLEIKRADGMKFLEKHGIESPPYRTFKSLKDAEDFCWKSDYRWVFKTMGDNEDKSLSYCSKSPADMIARLQRWQLLGMNPKGEVMLQEFIPGIELGVSRWMGKKGYISPPCLNWEHKKLMSGNYGPNTGEMGTVMQYVEEDKLDVEMLKPIEADLLKLGHLGDVDINCIIDEKGKSWPLEFTNRPGWPAFNMMLEQHRGDPIQWMRDALDGKSTLDVSHAVGVCAVLATPDFPYCKAPIETKDGIPIYGLTDKLKKHVQPQSVRIDKAPDMEGKKTVERSIWVTSGEYVAVVTSLESTVEKASEKCYRMVKEISIPDMLVRTDIGKGLEESLPKLHALGYAKETKWQ